MQMIKYKLSRMTFVFIALFYSLISYGQNTVSVTGSVLESENREPLIGVTVIEKGTGNGTVTDYDGKFTLRTTANATLVFNYLGYAAKEVNAGDGGEISVLMEEQTQSLDELVVIGYGVQKKSDLTGSISSISGRNVNDVPVASVLQALQGKAAGITVIQNTGAPGSTTTIKVRGTGTVNDADPLYVVDGFIVDGIDHLNPNDIANVEIFKDAASSSIYGARGANGIVAITTKSGEKAETKITFDSYVGFSTPWKTIPVLDIEQYALMQDYINGTSLYSADGQLYHSKDPATQELYYNERIFNDIDTIRRNSPGNWWDAITRTGIRQQYNLSVSGGNEKNRYLVSGSYYDEKGIVNTSSYNRFNTRMNLNSELAKWLQLTASMSYAWEDRDIVPEGQNSVLKRALYQSPMTYTYNERGYWSSDHPLAVLDRNHNNLRRHRLDVNLSLNAQLGKLLNYQFKISDYIVPETKSLFTEVNKLDEDFVMTDLSTVYQHRTLTNKWEMNNLLTFTWKNEAHDLTALAGQIIEGYNYSFQESTKKGTASNESELWYLTGGYTGDKTYGYGREWTAVGFVGRINYNLLDRYLFQANFRADASSVFSEKNRWGYFPSLSFGWKFISEPFMQNQQLLSFGKLRVGWGQLGNNRIDEMARYTLLNTQYNYPLGVGSHILYPGITATSIGNSDIRWEKTETANIGLDLGFFRNSLDFSVEVFNRLTTDMLLRVPVLISAGLDDAPMVNAGSVRNRGIEFSFNYKNKINQFRYELGLNVSYIKNEVMSLGTGNEPVWGGWLDESNINDFVTKTEVGRPIGSFYGYVTDGIFNTEEEIKASAQYDYGKNDFEQTTRPGDFRFVDITGDGKITAEDRTYLGSPMPDFVFGIPLSFGYKNFDLTLFFQGQTGNKVFNVMDYYLNNAASSYNLYADIREKQWSGQLREDRAFLPLNLNGSVPDLRNVDLNRNFRASDFMLKDGSYIRLKELRLTYNFDKSICSKFSAQDLSLFVGAYNLLTFTRYNGFDPEIGKLAGTESNNINLGIDHGTYPQSRTVTIGLKITL
jgi:TonB-linked SusC/RagA family outer membrane protein